MRTRYVDSLPTPSSPNFNFCTTIYLNVIKIHHDIYRIIIYCILFVFSLVHVALFISCPVFYEGKNIEFSLYF